MAASVLFDNHASGDAVHAGWAARLELRFALEHARTVLAGRQHHGPLRIQKALYPEGPRVCQVIIVHPPGGIVGGDSLAIDIIAGPGSFVQVATPGAAKWYRSSGPLACADTRLSVGAAALIEWLPHDNLLFDGARAATRLSVDLAGDARFIGWDVITLGRTESHESFSAGTLRQRVELSRDGALIWCERTAIDGGSRALQSASILNSAPVFGTFLAAGAVLHAQMLTDCRAVKCASGEGAVTRLPEVFVARYRGDSAHAARAYFATLWTLLRPMFAGRDAVPPRIWNT